MDNSPNRFIYSIVLIFGILAVSTASIFIRFAQEEAPSLVIAALRLVFASIILAPYALIYHRKELFAITRVELVFCLLSGIFLAIHFATWISSLEYTTVASSVVFVSTGPLWVTLLSPIFLKEKLARPALIGLGLTLMGGTIIGLANGCVWTGSLSCPNFSAVLHGRSMFGNILALFGAWAVTGYLIIGRRLRGNISVIPYIFLVYSFSAVVLVIIMIIAGKTPLGYQTKTYLWILLLALLPQLVGHSIYNWSLRFLPASIVAITTLGEPIGSAVLAFMILNEKPSTIVLFGAAIILTGIYIAAKYSGGFNEVQKDDHNGNFI